MTPLILLWLCVASLCAGFINAIAGGGTILTFPALLLVIDPVTANCTSTVALVPGTLASTWGYRKELADCGPWPWILLPPSLIGAVCGALLLILFDEKYFKALVPWLILTATLLFLAQPLVARWSKPRVLTQHGSLPFILCLQFLASIYGGYFGAGMGIISLAVFTLLPLAGLHQMNALKTFLGFFLNAAAIIIFVLHDQVAWRFAPMMALCAIVGGYLGARWALRIRPERIRWIVVTIGFTLSAYYFAK